jgi:hypothetical protein
LVQPRINILPIKIVLISNDEIARRDLFIKLPDVVQKITTGRKGISAKAAARCKDVFYNLLYLLDVSN